MVPVGSSFEVHDCSSLNEGAASACEFAVVKIVKQNCFYMKAKHERIWDMNKRAYTQKQLFLCIAFNVCTVKTDNTGFLQFVRVCVDV